MNDQQHANVHAAVYNNSYCQMIPWAKSIGMQTSMAKFRSMHELPSLAMEYLRNTQHSRHRRDNDSAVYAYLQDAGVTMLSLRSPDNFICDSAIALPPNLPLKLGLDEAMLRRKSCRQYTGDPMSLVELATIIRSGVGISNDLPVELMSGESTTLSRRQVASAGALYPIDMIVVSLNINKLPTGLYYYRPENDVLVPHTDANIVDKLRQTISVPDDVLSLTRANALIFLVAHPWRTLRKYGDRGLRFIFHEAGAISQNMHLATAAIGLGGVDCDSVVDEDVHALLNIDGCLCFLAHSMVIGTPGVNV